jgi:2-beta-glucuronyltransferase
LDRALVFTGHFPDAKRKASIHALCEALLRQGWTLDFVTLGHSFLSRFTPRNQWPHVAQRPVNTWVQLAPNLSSFVWRAPFHPMNLRYGLLNSIADPLYRIYPRLLPAEVFKRAEGARMVLFEGSISTMFMGMMRAMVPGAVLVYNAADRLRTVGAHPLLARCEMQHAPILDLVRVPAQVMTGDYPGGTRVVCIPHGIDKAALSAEVRNPFSSPRNAISIGDMLFDAWALDVLAEAYPDWNFHIFGVGAAARVPRKNVMVCGEKAFADLVPYLRYADIGLAPYRDSRDAIYLSQSSLKMIQYTYCRLPILAPSFASVGRPHACAYEPGNAASLREAFARAIHYDRSTIPAAEVSSWDDVLEEVLQRAFLSREQRFSDALQAGAPR